MRFLSLVILFPVLAHAQLSQRWSVEQGGTESGWLWQDINGDGLKDLIKEDGQGTSFLDGDASYAALWTVIDPDPQSNSWFSLAQHDEDTFVFTRVNTTDQLSEIIVYNLYSSVPLWNSGVLPGVLYRVTIGDYDGSGSVEVAAAWNNLSDDAYTGNWGSWALQSGSSTQQNTAAAGYLAGPWSGAMENEGEDLLLFNHYLADGTNLLECYGLETSTIAADPLTNPVTPNLQSFPNPFNPSCHVRITNPPAGSFDVSVHDLRGALVRQWTLNSAGPLQLIWDGRNQLGQPVGSGVYIIDAPGMQHKVTLQR